jgi:hypothetical protein
MPKMGLRETFPRLHRTAGGGNLQFHRKSNDAEWQQFVHDSTDCHHGTDCRLDGQPFRREHVDLPALRRRFHIWDVSGRRKRSPAQTPSSDGPALGSIADGSWLWRDRSQPIESTTAAARRYGYPVRHLQRDRHRKFGIGPTFGSCADRGAVERAASQPRSLAASKHSPTMETQHAASLLSNRIPATPELVTARCNPPLRCL